MSMRFLTVFLLAGVAACSSAPAPTPPAPRPAPPQAAAPAPTPMPKTAVDWTDWPLAPGDWAYRQDERGSIALFGPVGRDAVVTLRCDKARQRIYLARAGVAGSGSSLNVRSSSAMKQFAANATGGTPPYMATEIIPTDPILDAMVYTRGRIAIEASGQNPLAIPIWSEIARVVEDCRR
jgi:hypothetical protein